MTTLEYILIASVVILILYILALKFLVKVAGKQWNFDVQRSDNRTAEVAVLYLNTLSRELGNELMQRDPYFFERNNRLMLQEWSEIEGNKKHLDAMYTQLVTKYPDFKDFDRINAVDYCLVGESLESEEDEALWSLYKDIKFFAEILKVKNDIYDDKLKDQGQDYLDTYLTRINDTKFKVALCQAEDIYNLLENKEIDTDENGVIETEEYNFRYLDHPFETRVGVHFKRNNQYGIFGKFIHSEKDQPMKVYYSHYRSNQSFTEEKDLDAFHTDFTSSRVDLYEKTKTETFG